MKWNGLSLYRLVDGNFENRVFKFNDSLYLTIYLSSNNGVPTNPYFQPIQGEKVSYFKLKDSKNELCNFRRVRILPEINDPIILMLDTSFSDQKVAHDFFLEVQKMDLYWRKNNEWLEIEKGETFYLSTPCLNSN